ncbi:MAG: hypothetical protein KHX36_04960 [Clostridiales bacterium]|nr:hypothetical protein [Clostridiales bacterium]
MGKQERGPCSDAIIDGQAQKEIGQGDTQNKKPNMALVFHHGLQKHLLRNGGRIEAIQKTGRKRGAQ